MADWDVIITGYTTGYWAETIVASSMRIKEQIPISSSTGYKTGSTYVSGSYDFSDWIVGDAIKALSSFDGANFYVEASSNGAYYFHYDQPPTGTQDFYISSSDILEYSPFEYTDENLINEVIIVGNRDQVWKYSSAASIQTYGNFPKRVYDPRIRRQYDAKNLADGYLNRCDTPKLRGSITIEGDETISLDNKFNLGVTEIGITGSHEIISYTHNIDNRGFTTTVEFGSNFRDPSIMNDASLSKVVDSLNEPIPGVEGSIIFKSGQGYSGDENLTWDTNNFRLEGPQFGTSRELNIRAFNDETYPQILFGDDTGNKFYRVEVGEENSNKSFIELKENVTGDFDLVSYTLEGRGKTGIEALFQAVGGEGDKTTYISVEIGDYDITSCLYLTPEAVDTYIPFIAYRDNNSDGVGIRCPPGSFNFDYALQVWGDISGESISGGVIHASSYISTSTGLYASWISGDSSNLGGAGFTPHVYPDSEDITADGSNKIYFSGQGTTYVYSGANTIIISSQISSAGNLSDLTIDDNKDWNHKEITNLKQLEVSGIYILGHSGLRLKSSTDTFSGFKGRSANGDRGINIYASGDNAGRFEKLSSPEYGQTIKFYTPYINSPLGYINEIEGISISTQVLSSNTVLTEELQFNEMPGYDPTWALYYDNGPLCLEGDLFEIQFLESGQIYIGPSNTPSTINLDPGMVWMSGNEGTPARLYMITGSSGDWKKILIEGEGGAGSDTSGAITLTSGLTSDDSIYHDGPATNMFLNDIPESVIKSGSNWSKAYVSSQISLYTSSDVDHDSTSNFLTNEHISHDGGGYFSGSTISGGSINIGNIYGTPAASSQISGTQLITRRYDTKPTASNHAGEIIRVSGGTGESTWIYLSAKNSSDNWVWVQLGSTN